MSGTLSVACVLSALLVKRSRSPDLRERYGGAFPGRVGAPVPAIGAEQGAVSAPRHRSGPVGRSEAAQIHVWIGLWSGGLRRRRGRVDGSCSAEPAHTRSPEDSWRQA